MSEQTTTANVGYFTKATFPPLRSVPDSWILDPDDMSVFMRLKRARKKRRRR